MSEREPAGDSETLEVGDVLLEKRGGRVVVQNTDEDSTVGSITAAGLFDAARLGDDILSQLGALAYAAEECQEGDDE